MTRPDRPTLLWDGECRFCARWIKRWHRRTGDRVVYRTYQDALREFPQVRESDCERAVQLVLPDGSVCFAAEAVLRALAEGGRGAVLLRLYERSRLFRKLAEAAYRFVARHRGWLPGW